MKNKVEENNYLRFVTKMKTTLLIMAAGIGSRFGTGIKQLAKVDEANHIIMDYSIHDAIGAGFNEIIFIIRKEIEEEFKSVIGDRIESVCLSHGVKVSYAYQSLVEIYTEEKIIYNNPEFMSWRDELLLGLSQLRQDETIDELRRVLNKFSGIGDYSRFERAESKLAALKSNIADYIPKASDIDLADERVPEKKLLETVTRILLKMQRNNHYDVNCDENTMNDYVRDLLGESYQTKDQTRQGVSESGDDAGEVDIP